MEVEVAYMVLEFFLNINIYTVVADKGEFCCSLYGFRSFICHFIFLNHQFFNLAQSAVPTLTIDCVSTKKRFAKIKSPYTS